MKVESWEEHALPRRHELELLCLSGSEEHRSDLAVAASDFAVHDHSLFCVMRTGLWSTESRKRELHAVHHSQSWSSSPSTWYALSAEDRSSCVLKLLRREMLGYKPGETSIKSNHGVYRR